MFLPISQHFSSTENRASHIIIEAVVLLPILCGVLAFASTYTPFPEWVERALVVLAIVVFAAPYFRILRLLGK